MPPERPRPADPRPLLVLVAALTLLVFAAAVLLRGPLAQREHTRRLAQLRDLAAPLAFDNDPFAEAQAVNGRTGRGVVLERALPLRLRGTLQGVAVEVVSNGGYRGPIRLRVAVGAGPDAAQARVLGVAVLSHRETPGLGDQLTDGTWLAQFRGRTLGEPPAARWTVRPDGGAFDAITGATVTSRAVTAAVRAALEWAGGRTSGPAVSPQDAADV